MYKVGDELLVKAKVVEFDFNRMMYVCELYEEDCLIRFYCPEDFIVSKTYTQGLADAWNLLKKVYDMKCETIEQIFDVEGGFWDVIRDFTYEEALAKIEAYEKENSEIKVGDVVGSNGVYGVVARKEKGNLYVMWSDGSCGIDFNPESLYKTGKHIDIESLLRQIGE